MSAGLSGKKAVCGQSLLEFGLVLPALLLAEAENLTEALKFARRLCDEEEIDEEAARLVIELLGRKGDEAGLTSFYAEFTARLSARLNGQPPAAATRNIYVLWQRRHAEQRAMAR